MNRYIIFSSMGLELVGLMIASALIGKELDLKFGTNGVALAGLCLTSLVGWLIHIVYLTKKLDESDGE